MVARHFDTGVSTHAHCSGLHWRSIASAARTLHVHAWRLRAGVVCVYVYIYIYICMNIQIDTKHFYMYICVLRW